ncbi:MAG TPA: beta-ketoacyl-ACP synthase, partial [Frankiaceae bacterium]|nr:beta-ketoacyl-ACP synthase [Frankiaceae bacterium]
DLAPEDVRQVNAHATSTPIGDVAEARALRLALGAAADGAAVTGTKSMTGHLLGAAGAVEAVATVLALREGLVPATRNLDALDDEVDLDVVTIDPRRVRGGVALSNSFGFGGHDVCLAFTP